MVRCRLVHCTQNVVVDVSWFTNKRNISHRERLRKEHAGGVLVVCNTTSVPNKELIIVQLNKVFVSWLMAL